jgi:hypothetical protein
LGLWLFWVYLAIIIIRHNFILEGTGMSITLVIFLLTYFYSKMGSHKQKKNFERIIELLEQIRDKK